MKYKIIPIVFGILLLIGLVYAGDVFSSVRNAIIDKDTKDTLLEKNINAVNVTSLNCKETFCVFNIDGIGIIGGDVRIEKFNEVCTIKIVNKSEVMDCVKVEKTETELLLERDNTVDKRLKVYADMVKNEKPKPIQKEVGLNERVEIK